MHLTFAKLCICKSCNDSICPVKAFRSDGLRGICKVFRRLIHICIERNKGIEGVGTEAYPFNGGIFLRNIRTDLNKTQEIVTTDSNRAIFSAILLIPVFSVPVIACSLEMRGENILYILRRNLDFRAKAPGKIIILRL